MTVTWIDTPGSTLASNSDAVDFRCTTEPVAISVSFGVQRIEERAFRNGQFLHPYTTSTRVADLFALRRAGGWPADFRVYIDEPTGIGSGVIAAADRVVDGAGNRVIP